MKQISPPCARKDWYVLLTIKCTSFPIFCYLEVPTGSLLVNCLIQLAEKHFWEATELCGFPNKNFLFSLSCTWKFAVLYECDVEEVSLNLLVDKGVWNHNNLSLYTITAPDKLMRSVMNALKFSFSPVIVQLEGMFGFTVPKSFKYFELQLKYLKTFILFDFFNLHLSMRQGCPDNYALIACQDCIFLPRMNQIRFTVTEGRFWTHSYWTVIMFALFFR